MKLAKGLFHKFYMKWPLMLDPLLMGKEENENSIMFAENEK